MTHGKYVLKALIVAALFGAVAATLVLKERNSRDTPSRTATEIDPLARKLPKLLDLGAGKCIPCKKMAPILEELGESYAGIFDVEFIDVWKNEGAGEQYGVRLIPTQIFYDAEARELFRHEGFMGREDILAKWKELGVQLPKTEQE